MEHNENAVPDEPVYACGRCSAPVDGEWHTCPYAEDINNDSDSQCNCCGDCCYECAMDI